MMFRAKPRARFDAVRPDEAARCAAIHAQAFHRGWDAEEVAALLRDPSVVASAARDVRSGALVGFALTRRALDEAELLTIVVGRAERRRRIGSDLLGDHLARLSAAGVRSLFLEVDASNAAARALYARAGFRQVGERRGYYQTASGAQATALILRRDAP